MNAVMALETDPRARRPDLGDFAWTQDLRAQRAACASQTITGIVHTRNEEHNVADALRSLGWVDRILVVDMESEDQTVSIARGHGADVIHVPNAGYVEPARNAAVEAVDGDWVLVLDADERISERLAGLLVEITLEGAADVVELHCHNWIAGQFLRQSGWLGQYHPRFFRRGCVRWSGRVHEPPEVVGRVLRVPYTPDTAIIHFNYDDLAHFVTKLNRYTDKEADALSGEPAMAWQTLAPHLRAEFLTRWTPDADGPLSGALAFSMFFYRLLAQAKHWERLGFPDRARGFFSNAFFEHLTRSARVPHLRAARELLDDDGFVCYMGLPDFRAVAENYLNRATGILGPTFDLYHVYRYTHGDPEGVDHYFEQLHKSLFDGDEVKQLLDEAGFRSHVVYSYVYPLEHTAVTMGFYAAPVATPREQLIRKASDFLRQFDGRFLRHETLRFGESTTTRG